VLTFKEKYDEFQKQELVLIGISKYSVLLHQKFAAKDELPFILLADRDLLSIKAFDVLQEKKLYDKTGMGVVRTTYILDEQGNIIKIFAKAKPDTNAAKVLGFLQSLFKKVLI
jgi:peroxiredoxin Q/BCP